MAQPLLSRLRVPFGFLFAAWYLYVARPTSGLALGLCALLVVLGCALRSWAAGYLFKGKRVAVGGPYAWIRNPLYMGSFTLGIGFCLALWRWPVPPAIALIVVSFLVGFGIVYRAKTLAEEKELRTALGEAYVQYASRVPPFIPWKGRVSGLGEQHFSGELYKRNREYQCILGSAAVIAFLCWRFFYAA